MASDVRVRRPALWTVVAALLLTALAAAPRASADSPAATPVEIDMDALLGSPEVMASLASDAIWTIEALPGRRLVQVPLTVTPGKQPIRLDDKTIRIRGARFIALRLNEPLEIREQRGVQPPAFALPQEQLPMMARSVTIKPEGTMQWRMERAFGTGAAVRESDLTYAYKLRTELFRRVEPGPPPRISAGADPRSAHAEAEAYRTKSRAYQELRRRVFDAPDEFDAPAPARIWVVMDIHVSVRELAFEGEPPLDWTLPLDTLEAMRRVTARIDGVRDPAGRVYFHPEIDQLFSRMSALLAGRHPYSARAVAFTLYKGSLVPQATLGSPLYSLVEATLRSPDATARQLVLREVATTIPPTSATVALMKVAAASLNPLDRLAALQVLIANIGEALNPAAAQDALAEANRILADPQGPPVADTLKTLMKAADENPDTLPLLVNGVGFERLPDTRRDAAIIAVVENAANNALAAAWVDQRLVGSVDPRIARRTLEIIASADSSDAWVAALMDQALTRMFGPGQSAATRDEAQRVQLGGAIPIAATNHSLFRALQHGDNEIRGLAWESLPRFSLPGVPRPTQPGPYGTTMPLREAVESGPSPYDVLVDVAVAQNPTPPRVVDFFQRQPDSQRVVRALVQLVIRGSERASLQASRALLKPRQEWPVDKALLELSATHRYTFAGRTYDNARGRAPLLTMLMRLRAEPAPGRLTLPEWFGLEIAAGNVPPESAWAERVGGENYLLGLVTSSDPDIALGAVSALVWAAGGDDRMARLHTERFRSLPDQSAANIRREWQASKREIYAMRLQRAAGPYRLTLRIGGSGGSPVTQEVSLGVVQLQADSGGVRLANQSLTLTVPDTQIAIRVEKPGELNNLNTGQIAQLALERLTTPIDLLPQADGSWRGWFTLPDRTGAELHMQPTTGS